MNKLEKWWRGKSLVSRAYLFALSLLATGGTVVALLAILFGILDKPSLEQLMAEKARLEAERAILLMTYRKELGIMSLERRIEALEKDKQDNHDMRPGPMTDFTHPVGPYEPPDIWPPKTPYREKWFPVIWEGDVPPIEWMPSSPYPPCTQENLKKVTCTMTVPRGTTLW